MTHWLLSPTVNSLNAQYFNWLALVKNTLLELCRLSNIQISLAEIWREVLTQTQTSR